MATFKRYPKIHRLGKEEVENILEGVCTIQEKIDGANVSIYLDKRGEVACASRNRELQEGFNGFVDYVKSHKGLVDFFKGFPTARLYGEWLVRHSIAYNETAYKKVYLYDVVNEVKDGEEAEEFAPQSVVEDLALHLGFEYPQVFGTIKNPTIEQIQAFAGQSNIGEKGEGVVIKNLDYVNKFGQCVYGKVVTEAFKEDNAVIFGGNNKHSDSYWEMWVVNKYITLPRVKKIMQKIQPTIDERLDLKHVPRIMSSVYHDMLTEEIWDIQKKVPTLNLKMLARVCHKKAKQIYIDILNNSISVADEK